MKRIRSNGEMAAANPLNLLKLSNSVISSGGFSTLRSAGQIHDNEVSGGRAWAGISPAQVGAV